MYTDMLKLGEMTPYRHNGRYVAQRKQIIAGTRCVTFGYWDCHVASE